MNDHFHGGFEGGGGCCNRGGGGGGYSGSGGGGYDRGGRGGDCQNRGGSGNYYASGSGRSGNGYEGGSQGRDGGGYGQGPPAAPPSSASVAQEISLFRSRIQNRWIDDVTIRILESVLVSKDVQSSIEVRSVLKQFMRDESLLIFGEIAEESIDIKLICTEFLIRVFAMIGDIESCMALRYEALVMRDEMATLHPELQVTCKEWLTFAEHSLENGFHSIANQLKLLASEKARTHSVAPHLESDGFFDDVHTMEKIDRLKDAALLKISSQSVQAQAIAYLKRKKVKQSTQHLAISSEAQNGSSRFRSGIKKRNLQKFLNYQRIGKSS